MKSRTIVKKEKLYDKQYNINQNGNMYRNEHQLIGRHSNQKDFKPIHTKKNPHWLSSIHTQDDNLTKGSAVTRTTKDSEGYYV